MGKKVMAAKLIEKIYWKFLILSMKFIKNTLKIGQKLHLAVTKQEKI
jgi:hypothetical protein